LTHKLINRYLSVLKLGPVVKRKRKEGARGVGSWCLYIREGRETGTPPERDKERQGTQGDRKRDRELGTVGGRTRR
jgi:hypothetical protein